MKPPTRSGSVSGHGDNEELGRALEVMTAPELGSFVRVVLDELDEDRRRQVVDSLLARAAKGTAGWKPGRPPAKIVDDGGLSRQPLDRLATPIRPMSASTSGAEAGRSWPATARARGGYSRRYCR